MTFHPRYSQKCNEIPRKKTEIAKWEKTKTQFLLRNTQSGIYYGRAYAQGKEVWKSFKTDIQSVARARLGDFLAELHKVGAARSTVKRGVATVEMASTVYLDEVQKRVDIKLGTKHYWTQIVKALLAPWPQSGVDIPTVSRWLGHSDGGTLAIQTYGVFRR